MPAGSAKTATFTRRLSALSLGLGFHRLILRLYFDIVYIFFIFGFLFLARYISFHFYLTFTDRL